MDIKVIKRNGREEDFDPDKIIRVAQAAGLELQLASKLKETIEDWLASTNTQKIKSLALRDKVLEEMEKLDPYAADIYQQYQKSKELIQ